MLKTKPTSRIIGDIGEIIFENLSVDNKHAYIKLERIYNTFTPDNILTFKFGFQRIKIKVPEELCEEIRTTCMPSNKNELSPSFVFDYLTLKLDRLYYVTRVNGLKVASKNKVEKPFYSSEFQWVEIKTNKGQLTKNQQKQFDNPSLISKIHFNIKLDLQDEFKMEQKIKIKANPSKVKINRIKKLEEKI